MPIQAERSESFNSEEERSKVMKSDFKCTKEYFGKEELELLPCPKAMRGRFQKMWPRVFKVRKRKRQLVIPSQT